MHNGNVIYEFHVHPVAELIFLETLFLWQTRKKVEAKVLEYIRGAFLTFCPFSLLTLYHHFEVVDKLIRLSVTDRSVSTDGTV